MNEQMTELVNKACNGDVESMGRLFAKTIKNSYFLADLLCADSDETLEVVKKAYSRVFCTISKLKKPDAFDLWVRQNIISVFCENMNLDIDGVKSDGRYTGVEFLPTFAAEDATQSLRVSAAVKNLDKAKRTAVILKYCSGMPEGAVARLFGASVASVEELLSCARGEIVDACGFNSEPVVQSEDLPVLTRIYGKMNDEVAVPQSVVRESFKYSVEIVNSFREQAAQVQSADSDNVKEVSAGGKEPEIPVAPAKNDNAKPIVKQETESAMSEPELNMLSFKDKINRLLAGETDNEDAKVKPDSSVTVPSAPVNARSADIPEIRKDNPVNELEQKPASSKQGSNGNKAKKSTKKVKIDLSRLNKKAVAVIAVAVIAVIVIIAGVAKGISNHRENAANAAVSNSYSFYPGGFTGCSEISYLNEYCCSFKYDSTGKYGLMDYEGRVLLQPNYDGFTRCGYGRDYSSRNSYHTLVKIGDEYFEFTIEGEQVVISDTPHAAHTVQDDSLPSSAKYDERDRYFNGYAAARKDGKWGYVSQEKDKKVIPYQYEAVNDIQLADSAYCDYCRPVTSDGLVPVKKDGYMGIINLKNDTVVEFNYTEILCGVNGVFIAKKDGQWGVIVVGENSDNYAGVPFNITSVPNDVSAGGDVIKYTVRSADGANVRKDADASSQLMGTLKSGDVVDGYGKKQAANGNYWICIKYNGEFGYVSMTMLEEVKQ
ncbi:MAG: WG repeat-containing protein [Clostridiales bacterium]|nr:WG repeat-containing protein [Clostridiales bacterium]